MSRANFEIPMTPKLIANYGNGCRPAERVEERFPMLDNRKRRITDVIEPFQLIKSKRRRLFEPPITPASQPSSTILKLQSLDSSEHKLPLRSSFKPQSFESLRKNCNAPKFTESSGESSLGQTCRNRNSRISSEGQIQKLSRAPDRTRDRLAQLLKVHVFVHVRKALKPFHAELTKKYCKEIGEDVREKIKRSIYSDFSTGSTNYN